MGIKYTCVLYRDNSGDDSYMMMSYDFGFYILAKTIESVIKSMKIMLNHEVLKYELIYDSLPEPIPLDKMIEGDHAYTYIKVFEFDIDALWVPLFV